MLAFYGWTDHLLINIFNTKVSYFAEEAADLFVLDLPRVSRKLVYEIEKTDVFRRVFWLQLPPFQKEKGPLTLGEKVVKLFSGERYYRHLRKQLQQLCGQTKYRTLFTGAFWSETLFLFRYLRKFNSFLEIEMVEEGNASYDSPSGWLFRCIPTTQFREWLLRLFYFPLTWICARRKVRSIYLYSLVMRRSDSAISTFLLPKIDQSNPICMKLIQTITVNSDLSEYVQRSAYFLGSSLSASAERTFSRTYELLNQLIGVLPEDSLVIKPHPQESSSCEVFAQQYEQQAYVDRRSHAADVILSQINVNNKLLIVRNSSVPFSVVAIFGQEPYVIFMYHLYDGATPEDTTLKDRFVSDFSSLYHERGKVVAPHSWSELVTVLEQWGFSSK